MNKIKDHLTLNRDVSGVLPGQSSTFFEVESPASIDLDRGLVFVERPRPGRKYKFVVSTVAKSSNAKQLRLRTQLKSSKLRPQARDCSEQKLERGR